MFFTCEYCNKRFVHAGNYEKHFCEEKKKALLIKTKIGKNALHYYQEWRRFRGFSVNAENAFLHSKYFKPFLNFIEYANEKMIPDKRGFIKLMASKDVNPMFWTNKIYYDYYIESFDKIYSPIKQVEMSLNYMETLANSLECPVNAVVNNLEIIELMKLIVARKLSPWFLLFHTTFQDLIRYRLDSEQKILLETIIHVDIWKKKFKESPKDVTRIKELLNYLKL